MEPEYRKENRNQKREPAIATKAAWAAYELARDAVGLRDVDACRAAGLSSSYVAITRSHGSSPSIDRYAALLSACGCNLVVVSDDGSLFAPLNGADAEGLSHRASEFDRSRRRQVFWELKQILWDAFQAIEAKLDELVDI